MNDAYLIGELKKIENSGAFDARSLDNIISFLERNTPEDFIDVLSPGKHKAKAELRENVSTLVSRHPRVTGGPKGEDNIRLCRQFFYLIAVLRLGADSIEAVPPFVETVYRSPATASLAAKLNLKPDQGPVGVYVEVALSDLGHEHDAAPAGILNEETAAEAWRVLSSLWEDSPQFIDWLIPYLSFRLIRTLANVDLFHAMHSPLPHYREFKMLAYLLWLLGRGEYDCVGQFARLAHGVYYDILNSCRKVFSGAYPMLAQKEVVFGMLDARKRDVHKAVSATKDATGDSVRHLTIRITSRFFGWYIRELSEAGRFHIVLWSLPMFEEAKQAFQAVTRFGKEGTSILLIGETGTGKESIAKLFLKTLGEPYVAVNCAGMTWGRLYKDLFGIVGDSPPLVANVGAILLDELDRAELNAQGGILRFLDKPYGECRRPGQLATVRWHGLTVATATDQVYQRIADGLVLPDLFWRFDIRAHLSPLRETTSHGDSFSNLFQFAVEASRAKHNIGAPIELTEEQLEKLKHYKWPGNLREMLEFADSLVVAVALPNTVERLRRDDPLEVGPTVFQKVMSRSEHHAYMLDLPLRKNRQSASLDVPRRAT